MWFFLCVLSWSGCGVEECLDEVGAFGLCEEWAISGVGVEVVEEAVELGEGSDGGVKLNCVGRSAGYGVGEHSCAEDV